MPITRLQSKKMHAGSATATNTNTNTNTNPKSKLVQGIDFIDASIEWRMNKITYGNCTFEYIEL